MNVELRKLALALLDDPMGIDSDAWDILSDMLQADSQVDIVLSVRATEGRWYLKEDHNLVATNG